ncbi:HNH endonuclease signature motif containing protein [Gordonia sp. ABSL1-1]|uniref:HNH endonuclease n=1 Tax=Gordonia sp. ABSL1-1 TaxID=3053923 RepID=UPI0025743F1C|nr:HNH endonuclease signature motif containing protein [Gordonia sp. ABSL1-1]MDL9938167.1 HNH endonuclease signature motif containing protein [Gordonia sp. ABSL1-1]
MFDAGVDTGEAVLADACASELATAAATFTRLEHQAMARKVLAAYHLGCRVYESVMSADHDRYRKKMPDKAALREVAWHFAVPAATAGRWMSLGSLLADLPVVRAAFLAGDLAESRASVIAHALCAITTTADDDGSVSTTVQEAALSLSAQASTNAVLAERLEELLIALDPEAAARARAEYAARNQNVRFGKELYGQASITAVVGLADARYLQSRITGLLAHHLCPNDPRELGEQRVAALAAIMRGATTMTCQCSDGDTCQSAANQQPEPTEPEAPEPEPPHEEPTRCTGSQQSDDTPLTAVAVVDPQVVVQVVTDAPTLAGLTGDLVPYVPGYGVIDPAHARELAANASWQGLYRESRRFARRGDTTNRITKPFAVGRPRSAGNVIAPAHLTGTDTGSGGGSGPLQMRSRPPNPEPIDPAGHGGLTLPPPGALIYAPADALRRTIAHTDRHCRGPYCGRQVEDCHFDHVAPFDHDNPLDGGWTILDNLIPLCIPCHEFKHLGTWTPTLGTRRAVIWRHNPTGTVIITHPWSSN